MPTPPEPVSRCCESPRPCVFAKALLARGAACTHASRRAYGEQLEVECGSPVARMNCGTLAALLHERARFALRLPAPGRPLMHVQALRLQCGGLAALHGLIGGERDAHRLLTLAQERYGSLTELPWPELVGALAAWQAPRRGRPPTGAGGPDRA